jgi:hypothetical protein
MPFGPEPGLFCKMMEGTHRVQSRPCRETLPSEVHGSRMGRSFLTEGHTQTNGDLS